MSYAMHKKTEAVVESAYKLNDEDLVIKETYGLLSTFTNLIPERFSNYVKFMNIRHAELKEPLEYLTNNHKTSMQDLLHAFEKNLDFGHTKLLYDKFFLESTVSGYVEYYYHLDELITVDAAAKRLGVSKPTVYKYLKNGLESQKVNGVTKIPKAVIDIWKDPETAFEVQWIFQQKKLRNQTSEEKYKEIQDKIQQFELEYGGTFHELYGDLTDVSIDELDEAIDVYDWKEYLEMHKEILRKIREEKQ